jgi:hypothetical protein
MRVVSVLLVLGLIAGARSVMPTRGSYDGDAHAISSARQADEAPAPEPIRARVATKPLCEEGTRTARDGTCISSNPLKMRMVHAATNAPAIARVPLGNTTSLQASAVAPEPTVTSALERQPTAAPQTEPTQAVPIAAAAAAATEPSRQATAAPNPQNKPQRKARRQHDQDWRESGSWREARSEHWGGHGYGYERAYGGYGYAGSWGSFW